MNTTTTKKASLIPHCFYERMDLESLNSLSTPTTNEKPPPSLESKIINNRITPFGQPVNKFVSQFTFNDQNQVNGSRSLQLENTEDDVIRRVQQSEMCSLHICSAQPKSGCRFMYDRVEDRFNYLENLIRRHALTCLLTVHLDFMENLEMLHWPHSVENSEGQQVRLDLQFCYGLVFNITYNVYLFVDSTLMKTEETAMNGLAQNRHILDKQIIKEVKERMKQMSPVMFDDFIKPFQVNLDENSEKAYQVYTA